jgi:nickel transport protein
MRQTAAALFLTAFAAAAGAHDLWLEPSASEYVLLQGHRHSSHAGAETMPYAAERVGRALCVDGEGRQRELKPAAGSPVRFAGPCAVLAVQFVSGYWTKTAWETKNVPKTGIAGVLRSWHAEESVKRIGAWSAAAGKPLGSGLEITPLRDPLGLKRGDKISVRVTDAGRPLAGVPVAYGDDTRGATGADGEIAIRLRHGGTQLISASVEAPLSDGKADVAIRSATLQFEIAP